MCCYTLKKAHKRRTHHERLSHRRRHQTVSGKQRPDPGSIGEELSVSSKTISKWETGRGLPDISLLEPLAQALGVSVAELLGGVQISNRNRAANLMRSRFYCCPVCGNVLFAAGEAVISCCGVQLPPLEAEAVDEAHRVTVEPVEDEQFFSVSHPMSKTHFISFLAYLTADRLQLAKLYPEGDAACRFQVRGRGCLYLYCNRHGLMKQTI